MNLTLLVSCALVAVVQMICSNLGQREAAEPLAEKNGVYTTGYSNGHRIACYVYSALILFGMVAAPLLVLRDGPEYAPILLFDVVGFALLVWLFFDLKRMSLQFDDTGITKSGLFGRTRLNWSEVVSVRAKLFTWHALELRSGKTALRVSIYTRGYATVVSHVRRFTSQASRAEVDDYLYQVERLQQ